MATILKLELEKVPLEKIELEKPEIAIALKDKTAIAVLAEDVKVAMEETTKTISQRIKELDADVMTLRSDPQIRFNWKRLCTLHKMGLELCKKYSEDQTKLPNVFLAFHKSQICTRLCLSEERLGCEPASHLGVATSL